MIEKLENLLKLSGWYLHLCIPPLNDAKKNSVTGAQCNGARWAWRRSSWLVQVWEHFNIKQINHKQMGVACLITGRGISSLPFSSFHGGARCRAGTKGMKHGWGAGQWRGTHKWHRRGLPWREAAQPVPARERKTSWTLPSLAAHNVEAGLFPN